MRKSQKRIPAHLIDLQSWQVRKKIIAHKKAHKHKVIYNSLKIDLKRRFDNLQIKLQILPQGPNIKKLPIQTQNY
jgi:hypothetical protein